MHRSCVAAASAALLFCGAAHADTIQIQSDNAASSNSTSFGGFTGTATYNDLGGGMAEFILSLTNTSQFNGKLVALAFDSAAGTSGWTFDSGASSGLSGDWGNLSGSINTQPFGSRSHGASTTNQWEGGGNPNTGLAVGETGTWVFTGSGGASVSATDFLSPNGGQNLVIRFRGFDNEASDKLPAIEVPGNPVPGIGGLAALGGLAVVRRQIGRAHV